jgi:thiol-disulfide isomerase/thioredoxin
MKVRPRWLIAAGIAVVLQVSATVVYRAVERSRAGRNSEPFRYELISGSPRGLDARLQSATGSVAELRSFGEPILVHFWATWCEPCRRELPELLALEGPRVVLVSVDDGWPVVRHFFDGKVPESVVLDFEGKARTGFGVTTLPDSYLIGRGGRPIARFHGARAWSSSAARTELARLLQNE